MDTTIIGSVCNNPIQLAAFSFFVLISIVSEVLAFVLPEKVQANSVLQLILGLLKILITIIKPIQSKQEQFQEFINKWII